MTTASNPDSATLLGWYNDAIKARHKLMTGQSLVRIRHGDREMSYNQASLSNLMTYISDLASQLAAAGITVNAPKRGRSRAIVF